MALALPQCLSPVSAKHSERRCKFQTAESQHNRILISIRIHSRSRHGLPDSIETYGLVSGLWTSTFALGAFVGPSVSGLLYDRIGFRKAVIFIIVLHTVVGLIGLISILCERTPQPYKEVSASDPLLKSHDSLFYNDRS